MICAKNIKTEKLNFLSARKIPNVKWNNTIKEEITAATPRPCDPYANKQIGKPILPVLGIINGGNSRIMSLVFNINRVAIPSKIKPKIASK